MDQSAEKKDIAILILGAVAGTLPWMFDKLKIEIPTPFYIGLLFLSVILVWWAVAKLNWLDKIPILHGRTVSLSKAIISCAGALGLLLVFMLIFHLKTTTDSVQDNVRRWADGFGLLVQNFPSEATPPDAYFLYLFHLHSGAPIFVARHKLRGNYVDFSIGVKVSAEDQAIISNLSLDQKEQIRHAAISEAAKTKLGYTIEGNPINTLILTQSVPIPALDADKFSETLNDMDSAAVACRESIRSEIDRARAAR